MLQLRTHLRQYYIIFTILYFLMGIPIYLDGQEIVPVDDSAFINLRKLYSEQKLAPPSSTGPWSIDELQLMFSSIERSKLGEYGKIRYDALYESLYSRTKEAYAGSFRARGAFETYIHTNPEDFTHEADWFWNQKHRSPLLLLEADLSVATYFYLYSNLGIKVNRFAKVPGSPETDPPSEQQIFSQRVSTNMITMGIQDFDTPDRAFVAAGGNGFSFQFGRDSISWGPGKTGNLIIGDHHKYQDFFRFTWYGDSIKFTSATLFFDPYEWTNKSRDPYIPTSLSDTTVRMFIAHRLEFRPVSWLSIEFSENVMYEDTTFHIKYLNPAFIYHNLSQRQLFNAIADIAFQAAVAKGISLYGVVAVDQIQAPGEGSDQPNAMGYMLGMNLYFPKKTGDWELSIEGVLTEPYLYMRDAVEHKVMTRERDQYYGYVPHYEYLGYRYGGDAIVGNIECSYNSIKGYSIGGRLFYMAHGEIDIETPSLFGANPQLTVPSGIAEHTVRASTFGSYGFSLKPYINRVKVWLRADIVSKWSTMNSVRHDVQLIGGFSLAY